MSEETGYPAKVIRYSIATRVFYWFIRTLVLIVITLLFRLQGRGKEHQIKRGRAIFASNHIAWIDPLVVGVSIFRELSILGKKELFAIPVLNWIIRGLHTHPVDRAGYSRGVLDMFKTLLENDHAILIFPEGTRQKTGKLGEGKIGVGMLSVWTNAPVVPMFVWGTDKPLKALLFQHRFKVAMGEPVYPPEVHDAAERKHAYHQVTEEVMARIAKLKAEVEGTTTN